MWVAKLKEVFPFVIALSQGAFVNGRQILVGVLVANEHMDSGFWASIVASRIQYALGP